MQNYAKKSNKQSAQNPFKRKKTIELQKKKAKKSLKLYPKRKIRNF